MAWRKANVWTEAGLLLIGNRFHRNLNQNTIIFTQEKEIENIVSKIAVNLLRHSQQQTQHVRRLRCHAAHLERHNTQPISYINLESSVDTESHIIGFHHRQQTSRYIGWNDQCYATCGSCIRSPVSSFYSWFFLVSILRKVSPSFTRLNVLNTCKPF